MKQKIISIREKYHWQKIFQIIFNGNADISDRLFMFLMALWFVPMYIFLRTVWALLFVPAMLFSIVDRQFSN